MTCPLMRSMLSAWALNHNITHNALDGLLLVLQKHSCFKANKG